MSIGGNEPAGQFIGSAYRHQRRFEFVTSLYDETLATPGQTLVLRGRNRQQTISRETDAGYDAFLVPSNASRALFGHSNDHAVMPTGIPTAGQTGHGREAMQNRDDGLRPLHATNPCAREEKSTCKGHGYLFRIGRKPVYIARFAPPSATKFAQAICVPIWFRRQRRCC